MRTLASALLGVLLLAGSARATWIEGKVYCDGGDGDFSGDDTPINGVEVKAVSGANTFTDTTGDAVPISPAVPGYYRIVLPHVTATYTLMLTGNGVPPGASVIKPVGGQYSVTVTVDTGDPSNARKTRNFLLKDCPVPTTTSTARATTSTSTSTSWTSSSTTSTSTSTSSTSSTSNTSSTTSTSSTSSSSSSSSSTSTSSTSTTLGTTPLQLCEDTIDHLKCYRTMRITSFTPKAVNLEDQFEDITMSVLRPYRMCNPVDKEDEGIIDPTEHSMCYQIRDATPRFNRHEVLVENQFGKQVLVTTKPDTLCTPAEKDGIGADLDGDRMKCYRVVQKDGPRDFQPRVVTLKDQFETKETQVIKPVLLCNPVALNGDPVTSPTCHQVCYRIKDVPGQPDFVSVPITVKDEFYSRSVNPFRGACRQISLLCVPSLKTDLP